jgi:hypothetical protein
VPGLVGLVAVSIGVQLFSFWGLIFSIPVVGALYALVFDFYLPRQRRVEGAPAAAIADEDEAEAPASAPQAPQTNPPPTAAPGHAAR